MLDISEDELKKKLKPEQYHVLREKGTERPFTGKLLYNNDKGEYRCAVCGSVLFKSDKKFDSGSGWPSFHDIAKAGAVKLEDDYSFGMYRVAVNCGTCDSHLGHVFDDPSNKETGKMFCINSASLDFKKTKDSPKSK